MAEINTAVAGEKAPAVSGVRRKRSNLLAHPGSAVLKGLVWGAAGITFLVLLFLIGYILVMGIPNLSPKLFAWEYTTENVSMLPAIVTTVMLTGLSLLIAVPVGVFAAIFLVEYAGRQKKLVGIIRLTAETLSGIPSIVYGLFGMLFFVTALHWGLSVLSGSLTMAIMILPLIMRTTEEAFLPGGQLRCGSGQAADDLLHCAAGGSSRHPGGRYPGNRKNRGRDRGPSVHPGLCG